MAANGEGNNPFCKSITADGSSGYLAESDRYHIYSSNVCPYAQRTLIMRKLKGLEGVISTSNTWKFDDSGWAFTDKIKDCSPDPFHDFSYLRQVYQLNVPGHAGPVSVPALYDKKTDRVVNIESADIMQLFNAEFNKLSKFPDRDFYPDLKEKIDSMNERLSKFIPFQYRCMLAKTQEQYETASDGFFAGLDKFEEILSTQRYLCSDRLTDSDVKLFVALIRWDCCYYTIAKLNYKRITDYPNLLGYLRELYQIPAFGSTIDIDLVKEYAFHAYPSKPFNPNGIIPKGPVLDLNAAHGRETLAGKPF